MLIKIRSVFKKYSPLIGLIEGLYKTVGQVIPNQKWARRVAPLVMTMFFFIAGQYWLGLLPIVGPITVGHTPLFRGQDADLNMTFALATVTIVMAQVYAARELGFVGLLRSEERRVGKECRSRWSPYH